MKVKLLLFVFLALLAAVPATAVEWNSQNGIGVRGRFSFPFRVELIFRLIFSLT